LRGNHPRQRQQRSHEGAARFAGSAGLTDWAHGGLSFWNGLNTLVSKNLRPLGQRFFNRDEREGRSNPATFIQEMARISTGLTPEK
jgi:hypothetical protein